MRRNDGMPPGQGRLVRDGGKHTVAWHRRLCEHQRLMERRKSKGRTDMRERTVCMWVVIQSADLWSRQCCKGPGQRPIRSGMLGVGENKSCKTRMMIRLVPEDHGRRASGAACGRQCGPAGGAEG